MSVQLLQHLLKSCKCNGILCGLCTRSTEVGGAHSKCQKGINKFLCYLKKL